MRPSTSAVLVALLLAPAGALVAQDATIVYRLGRDTVAVETFTRSATALAGEMVTRSGAAVVRTQYEFTLAGGRPTAAVIRRRAADGSPLANAPTEVRYVFRADSAHRTLVWRDSSRTQGFAAGWAMPAMPVFAYAPFELIHARATGRDSLHAIALAGNAAGVIGLQPYAADTMRMRGGIYQMQVLFDRAGRLQRVDGGNTTNKSIGTRTAGRADIATLAAAMKPTGVLSPRATAYAAFGRGPIFVNYGRPATRERSVWGGMLVPFDSIWRTGANEATHLATSRTIAFGDVVLAPGLYSLWIQHTRAGTVLIVNRQVGQWGTEYDAAQDLGRVRMELTPTAEHVEDFTITVRPAGGATRGTLEFAWGDRMATAAFTVRP